MRTAAVNTSKSICNKSHPQVAYAVDTGIAGQTMREETTVFSKTISTKCEC